MYTSKVKRTRSNSEATIETTLVPLGISSVRICRFDEMEGEDKFKSGKTTRPPKAGIFFGSEVYYVFSNEEVYIVNEKGVTIDII